MTLFLHICTGLGLALAAGIRPFTPALVAGALARGDVLFDFKGTHYAFLQSPWFLLVVALGFGACAILRGRATRELVATAGIALGGLLFAAILAAHHDAAWPGLIGGILAGGLATLASRPVLRGASERLADGAARFAVLLYADAAALVLAAACWFAGPLALVALAFLGRLAWVQRGKGPPRFAGLRVLR
jgi:Domain of unknown function (DUF4126)